MPNGLLAYASENVIFQAKKKYLKRLVLSVNCMQDKKWLLTLYSETVKRCQVKQFSDISDTRGLVVTNIT